MAGEALELVEFLKEKKLDDFANIILQSLKFGGTCLVREDLSAISDPKDVSMITEFFDTYRTEENGVPVGFNFLAAQPIVASIATKSNYFDLFWVLEKKLFIDDVKTGVTTFRDFLDKTQYTTTSIGAYEFIFGGANFISPGGWSENLRVLKRFKNLKPGQAMLDIGVGIGGGARQAASEFGLQVTGIDLSSNMISQALLKNHRDKDTRVKFLIGDAMKYDFPANSFDAVFSRDCVQHINDLQGLLGRIMKWLKPGGQVLITMYGRGHGPKTDLFKQYVSDRAYFLRSRDEVRQIASKVGYKEVLVEDMTYRFREILMAERARLVEQKIDFLRKFGQREYDSLISGWSAKIEFVAADLQNWNMLIATKPLDK
ncbi:unnamed protein product, partial [Mesorhabditis spiculigera]